MAPRPSSIGSTMREGVSFDSSSCLPIDRKRNISADSSDSSESTDLSDFESGRNATCADSITLNVSKQPAAHQGNPAKKRRSEVSNTDFNPMHSVVPPVGRRSDVYDSSKDYQPGPSQPNTSKSTTTVNDREERRKQGAIAQIEYLLDRKFEQIFTPWAGDDQEVSRNTLIMILKVVDLMNDSSPQTIAQTLNRALNGGTGKREDMGGRRPVEKWFKDLEAVLKATKTRSSNSGPTNVPSLSSANPQPPNHMNLQKTQAKTSQGASSHPQSTSFTSNRQQPHRNQDSDMSPPTRLSRHKQNHTTLIVRVAPFAKYQPVTLSECMSLQSFCNEVLGAWCIRAERVAEVSVTFTWKDPEDPMRMMVMNSRREACFEHLIEQVDDAPGWDESDKKHILDVEIVLKN